MLPFRDHPARFSPLEWPAERTTDTTMLSHDHIWTAIDTLAARHGLTASGLAKRAGLDPTAFNKSKRIAGGGRPRWPTTESLAKVLAATGTPPEDLVGLFGLVERKGVDRPIEGGPAGFFDGDGAKAALRASLSTRAPTLVFKVPDPGLPPLYRIGDRLVLDLADALNPGARALAIEGDGTIHAGEVLSTGTRGALAIGSRDGKIILGEHDIAFAARIIWASQ
jgi:hypothetical protein